MENYLSQLNQQQREAVEYLESPMLVIAGAGSGKTRVLTYKIVHLLAKGYNPSRILALTFTNKAAREMKKRIADLMGEEVSRRIWAGTFHSMFLRLLQQHGEKVGFKGRFTIFDPSDSKSMLKSIVKEMGLDDKIYNVSFLINVISMSKNRLIAPEDYVLNKDLMELDRRSKRPMIHAIYRAYRNRCKISNIMDFDDILFYTFELLRDNPDLRHHYKEFFQYVLVDEYQDTNLLQHQIIKLLTENQNNLMVVGDDAQSIYGFRGAHLGNILNLQTSYPTLKTFKLERNYRSTQNIINVANSLIANNKRQIQKEIYSENEAGRPIEILKSYSDFEEGYLISHKITQLQQSLHDSFNDFAILYRTNAQSRILEESLRKRNIPYRIYGSTSFYQRAEIKDAIAYFRLTVNPDDDEALRRIINYPSRGIGTATLAKLAGKASEKNVSLWQMLQPGNVAEIEVNAGTRQKLENFRLLMQAFIDSNKQGADAYSLGKDIITRTGLLAVLFHNHTPENISKQENLNELLSGLNSFVVNKQEEEGGIGLSDFLNEVSLMTDLDNKEDANVEAVTMMTVHAAKGLEFKHVMIVGVEEDLFPTALSKSSFEELEEERRLMYVAITRAIKTCIISFAEKRYRNGQTVMCRPSRFIDELDPKYLKSKLSASTFCRDDSRYESVTQYSKPRASAQFTQILNRNDNASANSGMNSVSAQATANGFRILTLNDLNVGDIVEHAIFGTGEVESTAVENMNERIVVNFENAGKKALMLKFARLKIVTSE